jgi:hypothetical protein
LETICYFYIIFAVSALFDAINAHPLLLNAGPAE